MSAFAHTSPLPEPFGPQPVADRIARAKRAYTTRRVAAHRMHGLLTGVAPNAGDLVLARVDRPGQHQHIEQPDGRRAKLWAGDEIVVAYGNRYAPDQFEAFVPDDLGPCHLVAGGGVASRVASQHLTMKPATAITPIGLLADRSGARLNLLEWGLPPVATARSRPLVVAVLGASMNSGKTTTATGAIRGLARSGLAVAAAKATGTGSGGDRWAMQDAGAMSVRDFTDAGHATTFGLPCPRLEQILGLLIAHAAADGAEAIVVELADGLLQAETAALVGSESFARLVDAVLFAAGSAMAAKAGADWLAARGHAPQAISGLLTLSPLALREAAAATGLPVLALNDLVAGGWCEALARQVDA